MASDEIGLYFAFDASKFLLILGAQPLCKALTRFQFEII